MDKRTIESFAIKTGDLVYYNEPGKPFKIGEVKSFFNRTAPSVKFFDEPHNWIVLIDKLEIVKDL